MPTNLVDDNTTYPSPVAVPAAGEPRTAASVRTPFQSVANRAAYLKRVLEELLNGTLVASHLRSTHITFTGNLYSSGPSSMASFSEADTGHLRVGGGLDIDSSLVHLQFGSALLTDSDCSSEFNGVVTFKGSIILSGAANLSGAGALSAAIQCLQGNRIRWVPYQGPNSAGATTVFNPTDGDYIFAPTQSANCIWRFSATFALPGHRITVTSLRNGANQITNPSQVITLQNGDGSPIGGILGGGVGSIEWVELVFFGVKWEIATRGIRP